MSNVIGNSQSDIDKAALEISNILVAGAVQADCNAAAMPDI